MIVLKFTEDLLHDRLPEKNGLCTHPELLAVLLDSSHLTVIQINGLPVPAHKRSLLLFQIFRVHFGNRFLFLGHFQYGFEFYDFTATKLILL